MKLITELCSEYQTFTEEKNGKKRMFIEGIFMQGGIPNRNKRMYPTEMLAQKVNEYSKNFVSENRAFGELGHPNSPTINGDRICMRIVELRQEGSNFIGKAQVSSTPMGQIVEGLIEDGGQLGVSSRGMGSLKSNKGINEVQDDFMIAAVDVVTDPSAPQAFVNGIMEGVDWVNVSGAWVPEYQEQVKEKIHSTPKESLEEEIFGVWSDFLQRISKSKTYK